MAVGKKRSARRKVVAKPKAKVKSKAKAQIQAKLNTKAKTDAPSSLLHTDIDRLYDLVQKKGTLNFKLLTKELGLPQEQVENYVQILEKHHLVKVVYPYFGSPQVVKA